MKWILAPAFIATVSIASSPALATYPAVNDSATYIGTLTIGADKLPVTMTTSLKAFNAETNEFLVVEDKTTDGKQVVKSDWVDEAELFSQLAIREMIADCANRQGVAEVLATPIGNLQTCKFVQADSESMQTIWFADIPFGVAQINEVGMTDDGKDVEIMATVTSVTSGTP